MITPCEHDWHQGEVGCEMCGSHPAIHCWECDEWRDIIHDQEATDIYYAMDAKRWSAQ